MAKYAYDTLSRFEDFVIDFETNSLFINHPMSAIQLHRALGDLFDDPEYILHEVATMRVTDKEIHVSQHWTVINKDMCGEQLVHYN